MSFFETRGLAVGYNGKTLIRDIDIALEKLSNRTAHTAYYIMFFYGYYQRIFRENL